MHPYVAVPAVAALILRAWFNNSLTPLGIVVATVTAVVHAIHPWSVFFALLVVFFLGGTAVTKVKHHQKALVTQSSSGTPGGEGPRTHIQVLANSVVASILILLHYRQLYLRSKGGFLTAASVRCWPYGEDLLVVGIISNYAAVAADTFSSELGILSSSQPRLLPSLTFRKVPPGTNGGVTALGTLAGLLGAATIAFTSVLLLPFCAKNPSFYHMYASGSWWWSMQRKGGLFAAITVWGGLGSLVDSLLGGLLQASVVDVRSGKIVEGRGGGRVPVTGHRAEKRKEEAGKPSRKLVSGVDILDNNAINLLMAVIMSLGGMVVASYVWGVDVGQILR